MSAMQEVRVALDELYQSRLGKPTSLTLEDCVAVYETIPASQACAQCNGAWVRIAEDLSCHNCYGTGVVITPAQGTGNVDKAARGIPGSAKFRGVRRQEHAPCGLRCGCGRARDTSFETSP